MEQETIIFSIENDKSTATFYLEWYRLKNGHVFHMQYKLHHFRENTENGPHIMNTWETCVKPYWEKIVAQSELVLACGSF
jgi:hypothetical protein